MKKVDEVKPETPWGEPSDSIVISEIDGVKIAFLPRHGRGHRILPTEVNSRANICAMKMVGVNKIVAFSAVGSLKEELKPLDFVIPRQLIDRTRFRPSSFFGNGVVGHVSFADPFCNTLASTLFEEINKLDVTVHDNETAICMEGPLFSTRAESNLYRSWNAGLINMSALPEAKLAREAEICYALVCMVTDYDCWREEEAEVDIQMIINNLTKNGDNAKHLVKSIAKLLAKDLPDCPCRTASKFAILTAEDARNPEACKALKMVLPDYF